uniref:Uncharacterized protein n=1 Tax=Magnetococcus massalia (strain MO-1) TaxID=451514 RepID=A0A1S7LH26_MAGMO|nr:protein of unknown function [Candidatus Magnetococcus massalia]
MMRGRLWLRTTDLQTTDLQTTDLQTTDLQTTDQNRGGDRELLPHTPSNLFLYPKDSAPSNLSNFAMHLS